MKRSEIIIIVIGVLVLVSLAWIAAVKYPGGVGAVNRITEIEKENLPQQFPVDVPLESGASVIRNYNAVSPEGRVQATRVFESLRSPQSNFDIYKKYFTQTSGWKILYELNSGTQPFYKAIFARGNDGVVNVTIRGGNDPLTSVVDVSFLAAENR